MIINQNGKVGTFCLKKPLAIWKSGPWSPLRLSTKPVILDENPKTRKMYLTSALGTSRPGLTPDHLTPSPCAALYFQCLFWQVLADPVETSPQSPILNLNISTV